MNQILLWFLQFLIRNLAQRKLCLLTPCLSLVIFCNFRYKLIYLGFDTTQGKLALTSFYKRESKIKDTPSLIEAGFKFSLEGVTIIGRYDRVDIKPGAKVTIIDYKSSENIDQNRANSQAKESTQLAVYALSYYKANKIIPQRVGLNFLETGIEGWYQPTQKDLEKTEALILSTADKIRSDAKTNHFVANPKYFGREPACVYCAYNSICPFSLAKVS